MTVARSLIGCRTKKVALSFDVWVFASSGLELLNGVVGFGFFPCVVKDLTKEQVAQNQDISGAGLTLKHPGLLESTVDDSFAAAWG